MDFNFESFLLIIGGATFAALVVKLFTLFLKTFFPRSINWNNYVKGEGWAVVTGASDGIGKEFALQLAKKGFNILLIGRNEDKLSKVSKEIGQSINKKAKCKQIVMDLSSPKQESINELQAFGNENKIRVLINNAGISHTFPTPFDQVTNDTIDEIIQVNCVSVLKITKALLPGMLNRKEPGLILNMGSVSAELATPYLQTYSASKAFLKTWSEALASELADSKIHVELLNTFYVATNMSKIKKTSWTIPSPAEYVKTILKGCGNSWFSTLQPGHAILFAAISCIPKRILSKVTLNQMKTVRKRALAKLTKDQ